MSMAEIRQISRDINFLRREEPSYNELRTRGATVFSHAATASNATETPSPANRQISGARCCARRDEPPYGYLRTVAAAIDRNSIVPNRPTMAQFRRRASQMTPAM